MYPHNSAERNSAYAKAWLGAVKGSLGKTCLGVSLTLRAFENAQQWPPVIPFSIVACK